MSSEVKFLNLSKEQIESLMVIVESMGGTTGEIVFEAAVAKSAPWSFCHFIEGEPSEKRVRELERRVDLLERLTPNLEFHAAAQANRDAQAERLDAFNNLWHLALTIGTSKPGEDRWTFQWFRDGVFFTQNNHPVEARHSQFEFPTQEKCQRFIREGEKWTDILWPKL